MRYKGDTYLYMLTSKGTILFYNKMAEDIIYEIAYNIYELFKKYEKKEN